MYTPHYRDRIRKTGYQCSETIAQTGSSSTYERVPQGAKINQLTPPISEAI